MSLAVASAFWANSAVALQSDGREAIDALYEQLFNDPANIALNLSLVKAQLAAQDLKGASGTLDRLLIVAPQNRDAQYLLAQIHASTGNIEEAKALLNLVLSAADSSDDLKRNAQALNDKLAMASDGISWRIALKTTIGQSYNPESKPNDVSYSLIAPSSPIEVDGQNQAYRQISINADIGYRAKSYEAKDFRMAIGHTRRDYNSYNKGDYEVYNIGFGANQLVDLPIVTRVNMARHRVKDADFMDEMNVSVSRSLSLPSLFSSKGRVGLQSEITAGRQTYRTHNAFGGNPDKTGNLYQAQLAAATSFAGLEGRVMAVFKRKEATSSIHAYSQKQLRFDTSQPLSSRLIATSVTLSEKRFDRNNSLYAYHRRKDRTLSASVEVRQSAAPLVSANGAYFAIAANASQTLSNVKRFSQNKGDISISLYMPLGSEQ